ncbi:hypothetical protein C0J45_2544 [Silurus meridionalis]|nr:hypothetical protein C0J45_2544 [Silurus meridionalis]
MTLSATANVILDPKTANPSLVLSFDGRSLRIETQREFQSKRNHDEYQKKYKHQYNAWTCVQAKEGYNKGKHYWEVDVKGKNDWRIGVVKESAPRDGFSKLNTATGYWTLRLQFCCLMALTEPVTKLNQAPPSKIGVHLDYEEGKLTFYNAENRKHIYTFEEELQQRQALLGATGYWTLRLQFCRLMALTEPVTKLNQAPPSKIGVHLDYEEGKVTFYDAENRKHIYTFKEEFRETVYPVFGTVETEKPLSII